MSSMDTSSGRATRIFARKCECRVIPSDEATAFLEENHRQGATRDKIVACGLFFEDELVAVMAFCSPRTTAKRSSYSRELLRLCFLKDVQVVGGASKLFRFYINSFNPSDVFTYQDMAGKGSAVYESCGMSLVSQTKRKQYLVVPGKTLATASRREALGMAYATRYGPDRILGTRLGEQFREDGSRKSNRELFIEELGWHIEETPGDRVYEWINPALTHYVYRITASDSDKYYYGVSHVKIGSASESECLEDGYWGSGGIAESNKFNRWKLKHRAKLQKEIIGRFSRKSDAYNLERELVGDSYKTDPLCLNSTLGGRDGGLNGWTPATVLQKKICGAHGLTAFIGDQCRKCISRSAISLRNCSSHGQTLHYGESCARCVAEAKNSTAFCEIHGLTRFQGKSCYKCSVSSRSSMGECEVHGRTKFSGKSCIRCYTAAETKECPSHGYVAHIGESCMSCRSETANSLGNCPRHGETAFKGGSCYRCWGERSVSIELCPAHGETKFRKGSCCRCKAEESSKLKECSIHGETKHTKNGTCYRCRGEESSHKARHSEPREGCRFCAIELDKISAL